MSGKVSNVRGYIIAREKLESAIADLIAKAISVEPSFNYYRAKQLLEAAREYARAFNRVETMRNRK